MIGLTRQTWRWLIWAAALVGGAVLLAIANQQNRLWWMFPLFIFGMGLVSLSLLSIHESIDRTLNEQSTLDFPRLYSALLALGAAMVAGSIIRGGPSEFPLAGMIFVVLGSSGLSVWLKRRLAGPPAAAVSASDGEDAESAEPDSKAYEERSEAVMGLVAERLSRIVVGSLAWYGFEAIAVGVGLLLINDGVTSFVGVVVWLVGLVVVKFGVQPYLRAQGRGLHRIGRVLIDASLVGLFVLFMGAFGGSLLLVLLGGSVMIVAVSLIGIIALEIVNVADSTSDARPERAGSAADDERKRTVHMIALALLVAGLTLAYVALVTTNLGLAFVLMVVTFGAGMWFVFRGEWIMIALLAGYILSWGLVDRADPVSAAVDANQATEPVSMVAIGDSFVSGEGAHHFFEGTNEVGGNQCRRAPTA